MIEKEKLVEKSATMGRDFLKRLKEMKEKHRLIGDVRGLGMMCGLELVKDAKKTPAVEETKEVVEYALKHGVILHTSTPRRPLPPLVITEQQVDFGLRTVDDALTFAEKR